MPPRIPWLASILPSRMILPLLLYASFILSVSAQSNSSTSITPRVTVIPDTTSFTTTSVISTGTQTLAVVNVLPTVHNVTLTIALPTSATSSGPNATASASSTPNPNALETKIDPAFGVLGTVLILTGLPSAFLGHKNRWSVHTPGIYRKLSPSVIGHPFS